MREIVLNVNRMDSVEQAHEYLKTEFDFPEYYGGNLDALYDCLTDISEYTEVTLPASDEFSDILGAYGELIIRVFEAAEKQNRYLNLNGRVE